MAKLRLCTEEVKEARSKVAAKKVTKYIFVTGGVLSGLGKGITAASIGNILKSRGLSVNIQKLDPYLNVDAGTLNPAEHGECFVTKDGAETDLDLGHYERFLDIELTKNSSVMSGRLLRDLIKDERAGKFLGKTVQVVPHLTGAIQQKVAEAAKGFDVHIVEVGGTVGDYESPAFFEAIRELTKTVGRDNCVHVQLVYMPYLGASKEIKTKPAQNAVKELRSIGIIPDVLIARCEEEPKQKVIPKLSLFSGVDEAAIAVLPNAETVYEVPLTLEKKGIGEYIVKRLKLRTKKPSNREWEKMVASVKVGYPKKVSVGVVAKYLGNEDTYLCVFEALESAAHKHGVEVGIEWINAEKVTPARLAKVDGIIVPGGFGERGIEGKITAATYAIDHQVPYLGLCLGMQALVIAVARKGGLKQANTVEVDPKTPDPVIHIMEGQEKLRGTGGTMRLGNFECELQKGSLARKIYKAKSITERHRHRYEVNNDYRELLEKNGLKLAGLSPDGNLVELVEYPHNPYMIASQYHPEFKSRPNRPHPMFDEFIASLKK